MELAWGPGSGDGCVMCSFCESEIFETADMCVIRARGFLWVMHGWCADQAESELPGPRRRRAVSVDDDEQFVAALRRMGHGG